MALFANSPGHHFADYVMGISKWQASFHQIVGEVCGSGVAVDGRCGHDSLVGFDMWQQTIQRREATLEGIDTVKQGFLVFLIVLVVGERLAFHQCQERHEVTSNPSCLATDELWNVGILFLRHDAGTGAEAVWQVHELKLLG